MSNCQGREEGGAFLQHPAKGKMRREEGGLLTTNLIQNLVFLTGLFFCGFVVFVLFVSILMFSPIGIIRMKLVLCNFFHVTKCLLTASTPLHL